MTTPGLPGGPSQGNTRKKWPLIAAGVTALLLIAGACGGGDDEKDGSAATGPAVTTSSGKPRYTSSDVINRAVMVGTVAKITASQITVEVGKYQSIHVRLAHIGQGTCTGLADATGKALVAALPVGARVTVVRVPDSASSSTVGNTAFIHLAEPGKDASETPQG